MTTHNATGAWNAISRLIAVFVVAVLLFGIVPFAYAQDDDIGEPPMTEEDKKSLFGNWPQWDTYNPYNIACTDLGARDSALKGADNIEKAFNYFLGKKLTAPQAAGILGNLMQESHVNPALHQNNASTSTHPIDGVGFGIAQWTFTSRQAPLVALAESRNVLPNTLAVQLDYMWSEMNGKYLNDLKSFREQTTAAGAARTFHAAYEKSADGPEGIQERVDDAELVLAKYGGNATQSPDDYATTGCGGSNILVGEYSFPLAPSTKRGYGYTLPCNSPKMNGPYTRNGVYTDKNGKSTTIRACHHDATPAFDLSYGAEATGNQPIYAFTTGYVVRVNKFYKENEKKGQQWDNLPCNSIDFKADIATDKSYYWYGHVLGDKDLVGQRVPAGKQIGTVAPYNYGPVCWQGGVHLHFDRGCIKGGGTEDYLVSGTPEEGGGKSCRDPGLLNDLVKIWEALPAQ